MLGQRSGDEAESLEHHLVECPHCNTVIDQFPICDTLLEEIRAGSPLVLRPDEPAVEALRRRLRLRPAAEGNTTELPPGQGSRSSGAMTQESLDFLEPPQGEGELGRLGGYRVLELLGSGGMGLVFRAEDVRLKRPVALKVIRPTLAANAAARERFLREAQAAAAVEHDHIVTIHQVGEDRSIPFIAMPLLRGESLQRRLDREGRLPVSEIIRIGREVAEGLAAAHQRGLVHRDVKPANVWLEGPGGRVKLLDFGLARAAAVDSHLTGPGQIVGTPAYMAPEQARGGPVDERTDLFALGCVLYCLATGATPFDDSNPLAALAALANDEPRPVRSVNPDVPTGLAELIARLLAKDPSRRPASARAVVEALTAVEQPQARPEPPKRRWSVAAALLGVAATALLAGGIILRITRKDGKVVEVPLQPGDKIEIVEQPGARPEVPQPVTVVPDKEKPFVLIRTGGDREEFKQIAAAVAELQEGDVLEVHGNGPFPVPSINLKDKGLTVRAAPGYRPRFFPAKFLAAGAWISVQNGPLVLQGCDFHCPPGRIALNDTGSHCQIDNCRFYQVKFDDGGGLIIFAGKKLSVSDCLILIYGAVHAIQASGYSELDLHNNIVLFDLDRPFIAPLPPEGSTVRLRDNTIFHKDPWPVDQNQEPSGPPRVLDVTGNLFLCPLHAGARTKKLFRWQGRANLYAAPEALVVVGEKPEDNKTGLAAWKKYWGQDEPRSRQVSQVGLAWQAAERLESEAALAALRQVTEADCRKAGGIGPNWDLVGPGEAYVRALAADEGKPLPKERLRPKAPEGGPVVLIRAGQEVRGYARLQAAADDAADGDVIELRSDGPFAGCVVERKKGLTVRAAAGYRPVLEGNLDWRDSTLTAVEGLHFHNGTLGKTFRGEVGRVANCSFEESPVGFTPAPRIEVVRCYIPGGLYLQLQPGNELVLRDTVLRGIFNDAMAAPEGAARLSVEQCLFWSPQAPSLAAHPTKCKAQFAVRRTLFDCGAPAGLVASGVHHLGDWAARWDGSHNVYRQFPPGVVADLKDRFGSGEEGSFQADPYLWDPRAWRLLPESPGKGQGPDGKDVGADVRRIATP
jgi:serine/threonine protein kinase